MKKANMICTISTSELDLLPTTFETSEALQKNPPVAYSTAPQNHNADCGVSDSSETDYSEDRKNRKTFPSVPHGSRPEIEHSG